ncbi:MAG: phosphoribosylaminoimidazolesuccinocarboxamide synthase [Ignavibacteriae bacterium]|nr:phosphoribosylaminoimidazolesuccinocarboxamide synthase [Ignavibacteriota bacterium]
MASDALFKSDFPTLTLFRRGKVRDVYDLGDSLLMVASDRMSAFDVVMDNPITGKGAILTNLSLFWFDITKSIVPNHLITSNVKEYPAECSPYSEQLEGRSMLVRKTTPLAIECVVRGYLAGSGWKEYSASKTVCGISLPDGLVESSKLPEPIFTPATKAETGHDENISFAEAEKICGKELASKARELSLQLYKFASDYARERNIILADTKFEFGTLPNGDLILIDEALTPDSSRYWLAEEYQPGKTQTNFDKQVLRDYLETLNWNKQPPPPPLPDNIIALVKQKYQEAFDRLTK